MWRLFSGKPKPPLYPSCVFNCLKEKCPRWVILTQDFEGQEPKQIGRCYLAWLPILLVELKDAILKK